MKQVNRIVRSFFDESDGELVIAGHAISALADVYETPLFVHSEHAVCHRLQELRQALPESFDIFYSAKANPNPALLRIFLEWGCGIEIASEGEFHLARVTGAPTNRMVFAGPGKTMNELDLAISAGCQLHIESLAELDRVRQICASRGCKADIGVRVNPNSDVQGGALRMGGQASPFGIDEENLDDVLDEIIGDRRMIFAGLHMCCGTQILDPGILLTQYAHAIGLARRVAERIGRPLKSVDLGGGLGVAYFEGDQDLDLSSLRQGLSALQAEIDSDPRFMGTRFILEPGRFLVAESGIFITRIIDIKVSRGKKFLVTDGGMNHHLAASGNLGRSIRRNFPVAIVCKLASPVTEKVDIVGPLCTPLDVLAHDVAVPETEIGDLVGVLASGAYARAASPLNFLSHPAPAEVLVNKNDVRCIRRRGKKEDWLNDIVMFENENQALRACSAD
jgi:diaminopimelate decarboxylase